jgi:peptidoglycan/xylan/chitin deacetylase (PgdA/CDA1 family)
VRVVVFHDVADKDWFQGILETLKARYHVLSPEEFVTSEFNQSKINVLITFDDGYASWVENAAPALKRCGCAGIFFINSGLLDIHGNAQSFVREQLLLAQVYETLSWDGARELAAQGHVIGGHSRNHTRLSMLSVSAQQTEIKVDKELLERGVGHTLTEFAYPFGGEHDYTSESVREVRDLGYIRAYTTAPGFADPAHAPYAIPRVCIETMASPRMLSWWVEGGYDLYVYLKRLCVR